MLEMYKKINEIYMEEKAKVLDRRVAMIGNLQIFLGKVNRKINRKIFSKYQKYRILSNISKTSNSIYDFTQLKIEHAHLKLRNLH